MSVGDTRCEKHGLFILVDSKKLSLEACAKLAHTHTG